MWGKLVFNMYLTVKGIKIEPTTINYDLHVQNTHSKKYCHDKADVIHCVVTNVTDCTGILIGLGLGVCF